MQSEILTMTGLAILSLVDLVKPAECPRPCGTGHYVGLRDKCLPCPPNTFMHLSEHCNKECRACQKAEPPKEYIIENCTATTPTKLGCVEGFCVFEPDDPFMHNSECLLNGDRKCTENMTTFVTEADSTEMTSPPPTACGNMTFLNTTDGNCWTCPKWTYTDENSHFRTNCRNCSDYIGDNPPIACHNSTHNSTDGTATERNDDWVLNFFYLIPLSIIIFIVKLLWKKKKKFCRKKVQDFPRAKNGIKPSERSADVRGLLEKRESNTLV